MARKRARKPARGKKQSARLSPDEMDREHAAELPNREAMSLLTDPTAVLPTGVPSGVTSDPTATTGGVTSTAGGYADATQKLVVDQTRDAPGTVAAEGVNAPNSTATASSRT